MSDIAIMSSHWEGFGLAAAEAMACGIPTIASNVDGLSQVIENGGLLFEKGNVSELLDKVTLLENEEEYNNIKNKGLKKSDQYDINNMVRNIIKLYSDLI